MYSSFAGQSSLSFGQKNLLSAENCLLYNAIINYYKPEYYPIQRKLKISWQAWS